MSASELARRSAGAVMQGSSGSFNSLTHGHPNGGNAGKPGVEGGRTNCRVEWKGAIADCQPTTPVISKRSLATTPMRLFQWYRW